MPDLNDFYAYKSTTSGSSGSGGGCSGCLVWILGIIVFLWAIGMLLG